MNKVEHIDINLENRNLSVEQNYGKQTEQNEQKLVKKLLDDKRMTRVLNLLKGPKITFEKLYPEYYDLVSYVIDYSSHLLKGVEQIEIQGDPNANYSNNVYAFEGVIRDLVGHCNLQKLTLTKFKAKEIIAILAGLDSQIQLNYLKLKSNCLTTADLGVIVRCLPKSASITEICLNENNLVNENQIAVLLSCAKNVKKVHILNQATNLNSEKLKFALAELGSSIQVCGAKKKFDVYLHFTSCFELTFLIF